MPRTNHDDEHDEDEQKPKLPPAIALEREEVHKFNNNPHRPRTMRR